MVSRQSKAEGRELTADRSPIEELEQEYQLHHPTYDWCVRAFTRFRGLLGINVKVHGDEDLLRSGEIFVFNHFARVETFIPQYFIYQASGAYCRAIAASYLFRRDDVFSRFLRRVGAVPHDHPFVLPFLAREILRGRKVIIFPEGGMVKDRRVVDEKGRYSFYSRSARARRKGHTGAARLALAVELFRMRVRLARERGEQQRLEQWATELGLEDVEALLESAGRPTQIVPANITFYPIYLRDNFLRRGVELIRGELSPRANEELLIEGNLLLRDTDMDIRLAPPVCPVEDASWWQRRFYGWLSRRIGMLDDCFGREADPDWRRRLLRHGLRLAAGRLRDQYMHGIYTSVTVNLSHLASLLILQLMERGEADVSCERFRLMLYLAVKKLQHESALHLHRGLHKPSDYGMLPDRESWGLEQFLHSTSLSELLLVEQGRIRFLRRLREEHDFDEIRLKNIIMVYANEVRPLPEVARVVASAVEEAPSLDPRELARLRFDDELRDLQWHRNYYSQPRYGAINNEETASRDPSPFLLIPESPRATGVLLVHGLLASPAEVRGLGSKLYQLDYPVMGVRLAGHGTSPWDLRERSRREWLESVRRGHAILAPFCERIVMVGFSTGASLALLLAAEQPPDLAAVVAVAPALKFRNRNMLFVPLVHGVSNMVRRVSSYEGLMPFRVYEPQHPDINYRHIPLRALHELRRLVAEMRQHLPEVKCPVLILQGDEDNVVDPRSAAIVERHLGSEDKRLVLLPARSHGILHEDIAGCHQRIIDYLAELERADTGSTTPGRVVQPG